MANYFYLINENKNAPYRHYIKNERWWFGGTCFADVLGKNGRCPLEKGLEGFYDDCKEIGKLLEEKVKRIRETCQKGINTDPYFAHLVARSERVAQELQNTTEDDKFIAYWE